MSKQAGSLGKFHMVVRNGDYYDVCYLENNEVIKVITDFDTANEAIKEAQRLNEYVIRKDD